MLQQQNKSMTDEMRVDAGVEDPEARMQNKM